MTLDAPVSGGDVGAKNGTLSIMAGGDEAAFALAKPLFDCMGKSVTYTGAAGSWQLANMAPRMQKGDFAPGFFIKHQNKDLRLAKKSAAAVDIALPVLDTVAEMYEALEAEGKGELGTQALIQYYEEHPQGK